MNTKLLFCIMLIFSIIISFSAVSASSNIDNSTDESILNEMNSVKPLNELNDDNAINLEAEEDDEVSHDIYVGLNTTSDGGDGSYQNPFSTLNLAHDSVNDYKDKINLYLFEGTYKIDSELIFNTSNLNVQSVNGSVVLKNGFNAAGAKQSFGLTVSSANFTMSNIIFDCSDWTQQSAKTQFFTPFNGADDDVNSKDFVKFNNCTFLGFTNSFVLAYSGTTTNNKFDTYIFNSCKFINYTCKRTFANANNWNISFNNCVFTAKYNMLGMQNAVCVTFDGIWWGQNNITKSYFYGPNGKLWFPTANYIFNRYAVFDVSENYLGNNQYEIIGKLMWNDTTDDDIDKLGPMTVTLSSSTGDLPETAILQDGTFRVIYTSTASTHDVTAKLDNEIITLNFNTTDIAVETSDIIIGQDQNITVTLPQDFNGTLSIKVNNKTYNTTIDNTNSVTYKILDVLPAGKHVIEVIFADEKNHIYGFNSTNITVSKVSDYDFNATVTPTVYLGDNATITLSLPNGATGNVTVKVGDNEAKTFNVAETITIDGFVAGDNVVNVTYNGNDVYDAKSVVKNISALNKPTIIIPEITAGKATTTTITLPENATGNVTVIVDGNVTSIVNLTNGSATVTIPELPAGKHNVTISYSGDDSYAGFAQTSAVEVKEPAKPTPKPDDKKPVTVKKTATKITAKKKTFKAKTKVKKYTITLKAGKKAVKKVQVILKIGKKTFKAKTNAKGKATFKIKKLTKKGKYTAKIIFKGNKLYKATTKKVKITVKK